MLVHFNPEMPIGIATDTSEVGVGVVLFHRYPDGSERPIANVSKTLSSAQRGYSQIQKEALGIIFALNKFHHYLYGRTFILVTDHRPLLSLFSPTKEILKMAANRLARWALQLRQYQYTIEYRSTKAHGNADALSRLPVGEDSEFDEQESDDDTEAVCTIFKIGELIKLGADDVADATAKDPVLSTVMRYTRYGWPTKIESPDVAKF